MGSYWLLKSEPSVYSIDDLEKEQDCFWEGVRNYQARNFMKKSFHKGDLGFFYHSNCGSPGITGLMSVKTMAYPDHTAWDPSSPYYDPKSSRQNPRWFMVDMHFEKKFSQPISLVQLKTYKELFGLQLLQKGCRLSIQPVSSEHFQFIMALTELS